MRRGRAWAGNAVGTLAGAMTAPRGVSGTGAGNPAAAAQVNRDTARRVVPLFRPVPGPGGRRRGAYRGDLDDRHHQPAVVDATSRPVALGSCGTVTCELDRQLRLAGRGLLARLDAGALARRLFSPAGFDGSRPASALCTVSRM